MCLLIFCRTLDTGDRHKETSQATRHAARRCGTVASEPEECASIPHTEAIVGQLPALRYDQRSKGLHGLPALVPSGGCRPGHDDPECAGARVAGLGPDDPCPVGAGAGAWCASPSCCGQLRAEPRTARIAGVDPLDRKSLVDERTAEVNRLQKTLEGANIKLASVASDIMGKSGREMLALLVAGTTDAAALAQLCAGQAQSQDPGTGASVGRQLRRTRRFPVPGTWLIPRTRRPGHPHAACWCRSACRTPLPPWWVRAGGAAGPLILVIAYQLARSWLLLLRPRRPCSQTCHYSFTIDVASGVLG